MASFEFSSKENFDGLVTNLQNELNEAVEDIVLDIKRVSSESAPHKTGLLEKSVTYSVKEQKSGRISGAIQYKIKKGGLDYSVKMHEGFYKLGPISKQKPGGKSKFAGGKTVPVGRKYLENTVLYGQDGYAKHLEDAINKAIKNSEIK